MSSRIPPLTPLKGNIHYSTKKENDKTFNRETETEKCFISNTSKHYYYKDRHLRDSINVILLNKPKSLGRNLNFSKVGNKKFLVEGTGKKKRKERLIKYYVYNQESYHGEFRESGSKKEW